MKTFLKQITPPIIYSFIRGLVVKPKQYIPVWSVINYDPIKGLKLFCDPAGPWQKQMLSGTYDSFLFKALNQINLKGKVVFDIGAHIGFHSFYFAYMVGPSGKIIAFEPNPKNIERFKLILKNNQNIAPRISIIESAVSDRTGEEEFSLNENVESGRSSGSFIESADTIWNKDAYVHRGFIKTRVKTIRLDDLEKYDSPDIIKIDVEGAEYLVLLGAQSLINKSKPILLIEIHSMQNMLNVTKFLTSIAYKIDLINKESDGRCFIIAKYNL